jgi:hypothetical protein
MVAVASLPEPSALETLGEAGLGCQWADWLVQAVGVRRLVASAFPETP